MLPICFLRPKSSTRFAVSSDKLMIKIQAAFATYSRNQKWEEKK
jgi:hypothetical protein